MFLQSEPARVVLVTIVFGAAAFVLAEWSRPRSGSDFLQNANIARNVILHGEFHDSIEVPKRRAEGVLRPYARRPPGYPLLLTAAFLATPGFRSLSLDCITDPGCAAAEPLFRRVRWLTKALTAVTAAGIFAALFALTASWPVSIAGGGLGMLLLRMNELELLAACLLLGHSVLAALLWRRPRVSIGLASGVALGLLALTRAIFQYWLIGIALVCAAGVWRDRARRRRLLPACAALVIAAWATALPWMVRNAVEMGRFGVAGQAGEILAIRAEYGRMTWSEVRGAFAYYLPQGLVANRVRNTVMGWLEPDGYGYARFDRDNPDGFYERAKAFNGDVAARADRSHPPRWRVWYPYQDAALRDAASALIREDWLRHAVLTLAFAERGYGGLLHGCPAGGVWLTNAAREVCIRASMLTFLLLPPAIGLLAVTAWRRRDLSLALLLLPAGWAFGAHAAATHFIPRYFYPLVPVLIVAFAIAGHEIWRQGQEIVRARRR